MVAIDWTIFFNKYKGLWVALEQDEETVVASGKTAKEALAAAKNIGNQRPILFRVPTEILPYVGGARV